MKTNGQILPAVFLAFFALALSTNLFARGAYAGSPPSRTPCSGHSTAPDLCLRVEAHLDTPDGKGASKTKVRMGVNYDEVGIVELGEKKISVTPNKSPESTSIIVEVMDSSGKSVYRATLPFNDEAMFKEKLDPSVSGGFSRVEVNVKQL